LQSKATSLKALVATWTLGLALFVPFAGPALGQEPPPTLNCSPEEDTEETGVGTTTITCTTEGAAVGTDIDFEFDGPNDDDGDTPESPDETCSTDATNSCSISYTGDSRGKDLIRAWIDVDGDASFEGDATEARSTGVNEGEFPEPDNTDVVERSWFLPDETLDCVDESGDDEATSRTGRGETYTCTATTPDGPIPNARIDAENLAGANDPDNSAAAGTADFNDACTTGADGTCTFALPPGSQAGTADICFWIDDNEDNEYDPTDRSFDGGLCDVMPEDVEDKADIVTHAWRRRARSNVSIRHRAGPHRFVGRVTSPRNSCEPGRDVTVRRRDRGPDTVIGNDSTNSRGRYRISHNRTQRRFRYYARVSQTRNCRSDTSGLTTRVR
jgi:hypothetical protein